MLFGLKGQEVCKSLYVWSLSGNHYDEKETMDNILILHQVQGDIIIFSGDVQRGWQSGWIYYKAVTTMVTNKGHQLLKTLFVVYLCDHQNSHDPLPPTPLLKDCHHYIW